MAIIRKPLLPFKGRFGPVVFYRLPCGLICRALNPHRRKQILKDPRFAEFRKCSTRMAKASRIGSAVYKALPEDFREFWMYRAFVGEAMKMLKEGMTGEQVLENLFKTYVEVWYIKAEIKQAEQKGLKTGEDSAPRRKTVRIDIRWKQCNETILLSDFEVGTRTGTFNKTAGSHFSRSFGIEWEMPCVYQNKIPLHFTIQKRQIKLPMQTAKGKGTHRYKYKTDTGTFV